MGKGMHANANIRFYARVGQREFHFNKKSGGVTRELEGRMKAECAKLDKKQSSSQPGVEQGNQNRQPRRVEKSSATQRVDQERCRRDIPVLTRHNRGEQSSSI